MAQLEIFSILPPKLTNVLQRVRKFSRENVFQPLILRGHLFVFAGWGTCQSSKPHTNQGSHWSTSLPYLTLYKACQDHQSTHKTLPATVCVLSVSLCGIFVCCSGGKTSTDRQPAGMQLHAGLAEINGKGHRFRRCRRPESLNSGRML